LTFNAPRLESWRLTASIGGLVYCRKIL